MPITTLYPASQGLYNDWALGAGPSKPVALQTDDGDTSYITQNFAVAKYDSYYVDKLPTGAVNISNVDAASRGKRSGGATTWHANFWRHNAANVFGACTNPTAAYLLLTDVAIARPGGGSWIPADFPGGGSGAQMGISTCNNGVADTTRCTFVWFLVTHLMEGGGFTYLVSQWLAPILAVASHGLMKREIVQILSGFKSIPSNREDFCRIMEAFRVRPKRIYLGPPTRVVESPAGLVLPT